MPAVYEPRIFEGRGAAMGRCSRGDTESVRGAPRCSKMIA
jgi:hypothetical protein